MNSKLNFEGLNTLLRQLVARENTVEHGSEGVGRSVGKTVKGTERRPLWSEDREEWKQRNVKR